MRDFNNNKLTAIHYFIYFLLIAGLLACGEATKIGKTHLDTLLHAGYTSNSNISFGVVPSYIRFNNVTFTDNKPLPILTIKYPKGNISYGTYTVTFDPKKVHWINKHTFTFKVSK